MNALKDAMNLRNELAHFTLVETLGHVGYITDHLELIVNPNVHVFEIENRFHVAQTIEESVHHYGVTGSTFLITALRIARRKNTETV